MIEDVTHPQQLVDDEMRAGFQRCLREMPPYRALGKQAYQTGYDLLSRSEVQQPLTLPQLTKFIERATIIVNSWPHP